LKIYDYTSIYSVYASGLSLGKVMLAQRIKLSSLEGKSNCLVIFYETALVRLTNCCSPCEPTLTNLPGTQCFSSLSLRCISPGKMGFA